MSKTPPFNGRAARITTWLKQHPDGLQFGELFALEIVAHPETKRTQLGASLANLTDAGKITRRGKTRQLVYRLVSGEAKPTAKVPKAKAAKPKQYASALARAPKPATQPVIAPKRERSKHFALKPRAAATGTGPETVEEFLARGGRIQYCAHGERGFEPKSYRDQSQAHKDRVRTEVIAKHKAKPRNRIEPVDADELDDAA